MAEQSGHSMVDRKQGREEQEEDKPSRLSPQTPPLGSQAATGPHNPVTF